MVSALFILALAVYNLATYNVSTSYQSTFNLTPGNMEILTVTRNPSDAISGQFQETSGHPITFVILNSSEYAAEENNQTYIYAYMVSDRASSGFSYTFPSQDTYYLIFHHGTGLTDTSETVHLVRTYSAVDSNRLWLGLIFLVFGTINLIVVFRPRRVVGSQAPPEDHTTTPESESK